MAENTFYDKEMEEELQELLAKEYLNNEEQPFKIQKNATNTSQIFNSYAENTSKPPFVQTNKIPSLSSLTSRMIENNKLDSAGTESLDEDNSEELNEYNSEEIKKQNFNCEYTKEDQTVENKNIPQMVSIIHLAKNIKCNSNEISRDFIISTNETKEAIRNKNNNEGIKRDKNETNEEKKRRKKETKERKRINRAQKKGMKVTDVAKKGEQKNFVKSKNKY